MEDILKFLFLLKKYWLALIIVPVIAVIVTFFLVRNLPHSYISKAQISTGIVDDTQTQSVLVQDINRDKVSQRFSNVIEIIKMNSVLNMVSYQLIIHDLTAQRPFKPLSQDVLDLSPAERSRALQIYKSHYDQQLGLALAEPEKLKLDNVLKSMKYDPESLKKNLTVMRPGDSDFITIQFESINPELSAFVVNTLSAEFIKYYASGLKENQLKANTFLRNLLAEKSDTLANRMSQLRTYKIKNGVLNLTEQSKQMYTLILEYDTKKQEAIEKTSSYAGALNEIDRKFDPKERSYIEASLSKVNQSIVQTKEELSALYNLYINNDFDQRYKDSYDSLSRKLTAQINKSSDQYITNPLNTKQELISQKLELEIQLDISRYSIRSLENKIQALTAQFEKLVPKEAEVQAIEMNIEIANKEYQDILNKYNQSNLESSFSTKMNIVQYGLPGPAQPSKKMLLVILSAVISLMFCLFTLFLIFFFDSSINTPKELAKATGLNVIGKVSKLNNPSIDLATLWDKDLIQPELVLYKNQLRSLRYEIDKVVSDKVIVVTSLFGREGKTLLSLSLAFAWKMTNKNVLIIDGNFKNPEVSGSSTSKFYIEDYLSGKITLNHALTTPSITVVSNRGIDVSLFELASHEEIVSRMDELKKHFDLILIETGAITEITQAKEWLSFSNDYIGVFKAGSTLNQNSLNYIKLLKESGAFKGWILNNGNKVDVDEKFT